MGDRRITDLTAQTSFASGDCLAVDNSGNTETKKITAANAITKPIKNVSQKVSGSSDAYSSSKAYSVGDLVIYNDTVYECTTACSAASWSVNQSNFTATTLSSKVTELNSALSVKTREWSNVTVAANGTGSVADSTLKNKLIVGVRAVNASSQPITIQSFFSNDTQMAVVFRNTVATAQTIEKVRVFYIG